MIESPIWDTIDCAPVLTEDQIAQHVIQVRPGVVAQLQARLNRYYATADIIDAIVDGKFFAIDFAMLVRDAVAREA